MKYVPLLMLFAASAFSQVTVTQGFVDDANRAFVEVKADREAIEAHKTAEAAKDALIKRVLDDELLLKAQVADLSKLKCDTTSFLFLIKTKRCH